MKTLDPVDAKHAGDKSFKNWILNPNNTYFGNKLDYKKLDSIKIWKVTQLSPSIILDKDQTFKKNKTTKEVKKDCLTCKKFIKITKIKISLLKKIKKKITLEKSYLKILMNI